MKNTNVNRTSEQVTGVEQQTTSSKKKDYLKLCLLGLLTMGGFFVSAQDNNKNPIDFKLGVKPVPAVMYNIQSKKIAMGADIQVLSLGTKERRVGLGLTPQVQIDKNLTTSLGKTVGVEYNNKGDAYRLLAGVNGIADDGSIKGGYVGVGVKKTF